MIRKFMKAFIFTAILISVLGLAISAQTNKNDCRKIVITAPETIQSGEKFEVSAAFEKENDSPASSFNWTIIKGKEISKTNNAKIVEIDSQNMTTDDNEIIVLANSTETKCQDTAIAKIYAFPICMLPVLIDQYGKLSWADERARFENAALQINQLERQKLYIFYAFSKKSQPQVKNHLTKVLNYLSEKGKLRKNRVVFLLSEADEEETKFQPFPENYDSNSVCSNCILINGENLEKLVSLFEPSGFNKVSKK